MREKHESTGAWELMEGICYNRRIREKSEKDSQVKLVLVCGSYPTLIFVPFYVKVVEKTNLDLQ